MYVISIGIKGDDRDKFTAIYFADKEFLVNRVSYPCTFSEKMGQRIITVFKQKLPIALNLK